MRSEVNAEMFPRRSADVFLNAISAAVPVNNRACVRRDRGAEKDRESDKDRDKEKEQPVLEIEATPLF